MPVTTHPDALDALGLQDLGAGLRLCDVGEYRFELPHLGRRPAVQQMVHHVLLQGTHAVAGETARLPLVGLLDFACAMGLPPQAPHSVQEPS